MGVMMEQWRPAQRASNADRGAESEPFRLPLVSIIVVNFNYGRFLGAAADSIFSQTYPNIECVIVDNASTDESADVLAAIEARHPAVKIIRRAANDGQTPAALDGLKGSRGPYVIFVDADDVLLPDCVETHIFVHLSLRIPAGFTSGDMLQAVEDQVVLGSENAFNGYIRKGRGRIKEAARPYRHPYGRPWPAKDFDSSALERIRFVAPMTNEWVWSPTSGNCFRRDALALFADCSALKQLRTGTDLYFCLGINAVSGSILIDKPVAVYRIHGGNVFSKRPQLNHVLCYEPGGAGDSNARAKAILVDHLIERAELFVDHGWTPFDYARLLRRIDCSDPDAMDGPRWARRSRVANQLIAQFKTIASILGWPIAKGLLFCSGAPLALIWRLQL